MARQSRSAFSDPSRVVPASGFTAALTVATAAAMAFLAVFALALSLASGQLSMRWSQTLAQTATLRLSAPPAEMASQTDAVLEVLRTTPGIASTRVLEADEQRALLEPWFGPDMPVEALALPRLIEILEAPEGFDPVGLRMRLAAEVPSAVLDDHGRWRRPLVKAAGALRAVAITAVVLIGAIMAAMVALAASFSLAANAQVIRVLRLVGAQDRFIARAFTRRFALRGFMGAALGTVAGMAVFVFLPAPQDDGFLADLGFQGMAWLLPLSIPPLAGLVAWLATRATALRVLKRGS
ncbi:MAG: ABC-type septal ring translocating system permease component FtsX [Rhodobacteraceae bacterium HLUCCA12]|nr:MAG: ABC-type septal ring translocating system permease component FtsX [Rhodobacteraceae bacterium HLUCCA12]